MINRVVLTGRLTKDVDLRYTQGGAAVATFTLAADRRFKNAQGERESDFVNCVMWRKLAENFSNFTRKGSLVGIEGRIQTRNYENQQGQRVYVTEVVADEFSLLESRGTTEARPHSTSGTQGTPQSGYGQQAGNPPNGPAQGRQQSQSGQYGGDPFASGSPINITDDQLPF